MISCVIIIGAFDCIILYLLKIDIFNLTHRKRPPFLYRV